MIITKNKVPAAATGSQKDQGLPWSLNFGKKANKPDQVKDIKDKSGSTVTVGLSSVVVDKHGASKDNNSAAGANNELNTSSDSSSSSSGPLVEFSSSQSNAKEARPESGDGGDDTSVV